MPSTTIHRFYAGKYYYGSYFGFDPNRCWYDRIDTYNVATPYPWPDYWGADHISQQSATTGMASRYKSSYNGGTYTLYTTGLCWNIEGLGYPGDDILDAWIETSPTAGNGAGGGASPNFMVEAWEWDAGPNFTYTAGSPSTDPTLAAGGGKMAELDWTAPANNPYDNMQTWTGVGLADRIKRMVNNSETYLPMQFVLSTFDDGGSGIPTIGDAQGYWFLAITTSTGWAGRNLGAAVCVKTGPYTGLNEARGMA